MVQGLLDFFTGGGDYADPTKIDPRYGVPMSDVRQAAINSIGNMSALLLAAGQPMAPQQRAAYLAQLGQAGGSLNTDLYNASQRRLMQAQYQQKMDDLKEDATIREEMKDAAGFKTRYGFDPTGMRPEDVRQARRTLATRDPMDALVKAATYKKTMRDLEQPDVKTVGEKMYQYDTETKRWIEVAGAGKNPYGNNERGMALQILEAGNSQSPEAEALRSSPRYATAWQIATKPTPVPVLRPDGTTVIEMQPGLDPATAGFLPPANLKQTTQAGAGTGGDATIKSSPYVLSESEAKDYRKQLLGVSKLEAAIDQLEEHVNKYGLQIAATGRIGGHQSSLYKDVLMQLKEAQNLGVLNGPDLTLLTEQLGDPTKLKTYLSGLGSPDYFFGQLDALRAKTRNESTALGRMLNGNVPAGLQRNATTPSARAAAPKNDGATPQGPELVFDPITRKLK